MPNRESARPIDLLLLHHVTFITVPLHKGRVHDLLEELLVLRRVWIMAASAIGQPGFDVDMRFEKRAFLGIVALLALLLDRLVDQGGLAREMGLVAGQAVFGGWIVLPLGFHLFLHVLVAAEAKIWTRC